MNWTKSKLIDVANLVMGQSPDSSFYNTEGKGKKFLQGCADFGSKHPIANTYTTSIKKIAPKNSILFSVRAPVGKINFADDEYCIGRGLAAIIPTKCDLNYLHQIFLFHQSQKKYVAQGSTFDSINTTELSELELYHPNDKLKQARVAQILSKADEVVAQTEVLIAKYQRIKTGLMQELLTKGIDEDGNIQTKATHRFKVKNGVEVPEEWEVNSLSTLIIAVDPHPSHRTPAAVENGVPYLGINDIDEYGNIDIKKCRKVSYKILEEHNSRYQLKDGDIIFGKIGTIGEPKRLRAWPNVTISANVILIQPNSTSDFIFWVLNSEYIQTQVKNTIHSTSQPAFGMEKVRALRVLIPNKTEREKIEKILNKAEENITSTRIHLRKLQSLKTGLMQDLLSGRVRVTLTNK